LLLALASALEGCAPQPPQPGAITVDIAQKARELRHSGELEAAAREFLRVARKVKEPESSVYRLSAAETYLQAQLPDPAGKILEKFNAEEASADLRTWARILEARAALLEDNPAQALEILNMAITLDERSPRAREMHELRAQILQELDRPLEAISEHILIEPLLGDQAEVDANRQATWEIVKAIPPQQLEAQLDAVPLDTRGWMELAIIAQHAVPGSPAVAGQFSRWRHAYPGHPGEAIFAAEYSEAVTAPTLPTSPLHIALLLPFEGQTAGAASAVRDGFVAAWLADDRPARPVVDVYSATSSNAVEIYDKAIADGAELVVGPLEKGAVENLLRSQPTQPILALNQVSSSVETGAPIVQFGLSPEDEARQVADRARAEGRARALVMTPDDNWGARILRAFKARWEELGGIIVDSATYSTLSRDFVTPVKRILDIDGSQQRSAEVRKVVDREMITEPHPREDADFLFLAAYSLQARQIRPQLLFFGARELPVYATSHVYLGNSDSARDSDLNGICFGDMPGVVAGGNSDVGALMNPGSADTIGNYTRLFAMGLDAYRIIPQLAAMRDDPGLAFRGATGELSISENGYIQRQLTWMQFVDGVATPVVPTTTLP
jgi:outer membrane PBP1 activator LpoA protein